MGMIFRRSLTIIPGVRLNIGTGGASLSVGPRGASVSVGRRGTYANVGLPGTGLSYRQRLDGRRGDSSGPGVEKAQVECTVSLIGDVVEVHGEDGGRIDGALRERALRQNADAIRVMLGEAASSRNDVERREMMPAIQPVGIHGRGGKPAQLAGETRPAYMDRLVRWRASQANDAEAILIRALESVDWGSDTDIACSVEADRVLLAIDLPELDQAGEWRPAPRGQPPGLVRRTMSQSDANRRYALVCARIVRTAMDVPLDALPAISRITVHARAERDGRMDTVIVADVGRSAWSEARSEQDDEMFIARVGGAMQTTSTGRLKPQKAPTT